MFEQTVRRNLLVVVRAWCRATGRSETAFSKQYYGASDFVSLFRARKCSVRLDKFDEMMTCVAREWPDGAEWPMLSAVFLPSPRKKR
jgi:hypothetical protein